MVKSAVRLLAVCIALTALFQCCNRSQQITQLAPKLFLENLKKDTTSVLLDVRTSEEFSEGHIEGALNYDVNGEGFENQIAKLDTSKAVYVYCRSGKRSMNAGEILVKKGHKKVYNMTGGIVKWGDEGLPVVK